MKKKKSPNKTSSNKPLIITLILVISTMFSLAYLSVPLYQLFCNVTGYGGTTQIAQSLPETPGKKTLTIQFDTNTAPDLPWEFKPLQHQITIQTGINKLIFYTIKNTSDTAVTGIATFNVTPDVTGSYFNKIQCFCFEEQTLQPGEAITVPVSFFVDPDIENDPETQNINSITLSYTFFRTKKQ